MTVFTVPDTLEGAYKGTGMALAASQDGRLMALRYLRDLLPGVDSLECGEGGGVGVGVLDHPRLAPTVRELRALGDVHFGICRGWEFMEVTETRSPPAR